MIFEEGYKEYTLFNGLKAAMQRTPTQTVAAKLRVNTGSVHELPGEEGIAHFLEHCLVTGGSNKYSPEKADEIRKEFGNFNAYTNLGRICFVGYMLSEDISQWIDYTADHVFQPRLDTIKFNEEKKRVLREISDKKSKPGYLICRKSDELFFRGHPKGRFSIGSEEVIRLSTPDSLKKYHQRGFSPNNMELLLAGNLPNNIEEIIENNFGGYQKGLDTRIKFPLLSPLTKKTVLRYPAPDMVNEDKPEESSAEISIRYVGPPEMDVNEFAAKSMGQIFGGDSHSLLFKNISQRQGLAYNIYSLYDDSFNAGSLGVNALVGAKKIDATINSVFEQIDILKNIPQDIYKVKDIKKIARYSLAAHLESNGDYIGVMEVKLDKNRTPQDYMEKWNQVTPEDITMAARKYLPDRETGNYVITIRDPLLKE